jgi:phthalate 4,5-cis-dihydrodiol dehydrogenase
VAYTEFVDGTPAVLIQNAYGYFVGEEMVPWAPSTDQFAWANARTAQRGALRRSLREHARDESAEYQARSVGGEQDTGPPRPGGSREWATDLGLVVVSCERGDIRHSPDGLYVYSDEGIREISLPRGSAWTAEIREMYNAVVQQTRPIHSGRWGMATLEVVLGIMESARTHRQVQLRHQVEAEVDDDVEYTTDVRTG